MASIKFKNAQGEWERALSGGITNGTEILDVDRFKQVENTLSEQARKEVLLSHGMNVIESDQASPLKVEFYGNTLVNILGSGGFNKGWVKNRENGSITIINEFEVEINGAITSGWDRLEKEVSVKENTNYLLIFDECVNPVFNVFNSADATSLTGGYIIGKQYGKFNTGTATKIKIAITDGSDSNIHKFKKPRVFEISADLYNKIGDLSLTGDDVEYVKKAFPYVNSVQHVKHPVVKVIGKNLFDGQMERGTIWDSEGTLGDSDDRVRTKEFIEVVEDMTYTLSNNLNYGNRVYFYDKKKNYISFNYDTVAHTFTIPTNCKYIKFRSNTNENDLNVKYQLELGNKSTPFTPYNPSYLYVSTTLAGNNDKKDILRKNYSLDVPRWEKEKWFEQVVLDGSNVVNAVLNANRTGYKSIAIDVFPNMPNNANTTEKLVVIKYDGNPLTTVLYDNRNDGADYTTNTDSKIYIGISDADSGWGEEYTPTANEMKANFYNWRMCDGTFGTTYNGTGTKTWYPKGDTDLSRAVTVVPTSNAPTIAEGLNKNYFLSYQLQSPIIEPVTVEGDLSIQGSAQVEVSSGVIVREKVKTPLRSGDYYYINSPNLSDSANFEQRVNKIIGIYKNGQIDNKWTILTNYAYGNQRASINVTDYDSTAEYTVTYEILDKHAFTTHLNEVKASYQNSIKSSLQQTITKQSDIATDQSILKRQMLDVLVRLEAVENGGV